MEVAASRETMWYAAKVDSINCANAEMPIKTEYDVIYDDDEEDVYWRFPLLMDLKKGDLMIID